MVSQRFRPDWFKPRTRLGYGVDWLVDWHEMWHDYAVAERDMRISGLVSYSWRSASWTWSPGSGPAATGDRGGSITAPACAFQKARDVVVAGYSIETLRLLLNSASARHPHGLGNACDQVGRDLMVHSNHAVWAEFDEESRWYKGPPSMACCEPWNYADDDPSRDFHGGYVFMSQGPLPADFAGTLVTAIGLAAQGGI